MNWPFWAQLLGFFGGGILAGLVFLVLAYRAERQAGRGVDIPPPIEEDDRRRDEASGD